jgi:hypothetical protein
LAFRFTALAGLGSGVVEIVGEAVDLSPVIWARRSPIFAEWSALIKSNVRFLLNVPAS